jgi:hypothetical protein
MEQVMRVNDRRLTAAVISIVCLCCGWSFSDQNPLVGVWTGIDDGGECNSLVFYADGSAALMLEGKLCIDGKSLDGTLTWKIDRTKNPIHLDLIATKDNGETQPLLFILEFMSDKKIRVKLSDNMIARPISFSDGDSGKQIVLHKEEASSENDKAIEAIYWNPTNTTVVVTDTLYNVGDEICGFKIIHIGTNNMTVMGQDGSHMKIKVMKPSE